MATGSTRTVGTLQFPRALALFFGCSSSDKGGAVVAAGGAGALLLPVGQRQLRHVHELDQSAGATPILATPIVRRDSAGAYTGAKAHVTADVVSGGVTYVGGDYPKTIRDWAPQSGSR